MNSDDEAFKGPSETTVQLVGAKTTITTADAQAMKESLLDFLARAAPDGIEDRDYLIKVTKSVPGWIDPDGYVRIGGWLLQSRERGLVLTYRMPSSGDVIKGYVASLEHENSTWKVVAVQVERIRHRR